jgi:nucleotide-binding universal stress UspA family protein
MLTTTRSDSLVCGVDDSAHARDVVTVAAGLAERLGLRLRLVHSVHPNVFLAGERRDTALRRGQELLERLDAHDRAQDRVVDLGSPARLLRAVLDDNAALAVVGSRGRGPGRAALLGSVSHLLAGSAPFPVVIVPPGATVDMTAAPTVVCGVDGSRVADAALEYAAALASALGGRLLGVHVRADALTPHATSLMPGPQPFSGSGDVARSPLAAVERSLAHLELDVPISTRIEIGYAAERLAAVALEQPSAILVVGSRGQGAFRSAVLGSVSLRLAASAPVPVMVVSPAAQAVLKSALGAQRPTAHAVA